MLVHTMRTYPLAKRKEQMKEGEKERGKAKQTEQNSTCLVWVTTVVLSEDASYPVEPKETALLHH